MIESVRVKVDAELDTVARLTNICRGSMDQCTCRSDQEDCVACTCGAAARELTRLRAANAELVREFTQLHAANAGMARELTQFRATNAEMTRLLRRYRSEIPLGRQPHMIAHEVDAVLGDPP